MSIRKDIFTSDKLNIILLIKFFMATQDLEQTTGTATGENEEATRRTSPLTNYQLMPKPERNNCGLVIRNAIALTDLCCVYCRGNGKERIPKGSAFFVSEIAPEITMTYHSKECQDLFTED